jgi:hypothetical protein
MTGQQQNREWRRDPLVATFSLLKQSDDSLRTIAFCLAKSIQANEDNPCLP